MTTTKILGARAIQPVDIVGQRITAIAPLSKEEQEEIWGPGPQVIVIQLENGVVLIPVTDPENNEQGWLNVVLQDNYGPITFD